MKSKFILSCALLLLFLSVNAQNDKTTENPLTRNNAWEIVKEQVLHNNYIDIDVYASDSLIKPSSVNAQACPSDMDSLYCWFFFVDDFPRANWSHECRYVFISQDGRMYVYCANFPPRDIQLTCINRSKSLADLPSNTHARLITNSSSPTCTFHGFATNDYAVIISGGGSKEMNHVRYWNDCSEIYKTLVNHYGYMRNHIYVIMADGTNSSVDRRLLDGSYDNSPLDLDGDGTNDIQYSATRQNIESVFGMLSNQVTPEDNLFVFTIDHGVRLVNQSALVLWGFDDSNTNSYIDAESFSNLLAPINARTINICMGQCYSGGFIPYLQGNNRIVSTACREDELSHSTTNMQYDSFVYNWTNALRHETPAHTSVNSDSDNNGYTSIREAFDYAVQNNYINEHEMYSSVPSNLGDKTYLAQFPKPAIIGNRNICTSSTYSVDNLPYGANVVWSVNSSSHNYIMTSDAPTLSKCTISNPNGVYFTDTITASITWEGEHYATLKKAIHGKPMIAFNGRIVQYSSHTSIPYPTSQTIIVDPNSPVSIMYPIMGQFNIAIQSTNMYADAITPSGMTFSLGNNGFLRLTLSCDDNCTSYTTEIHAGEIVHYNLSVSPISNDVFTINLTGDDSEHALWNLEVLNGQTSKVVYSCPVKGNSTTINTNNWQRSMYIVRAVIGNNTVSCKLIK